ncbi:MAG: IPTL-CTERM sorting domain-containing protein [Halothiobacillaceae bacterium]|nr:IPTL-CTERM sorting domain-containing protein [Halothiobacillaceae bacterium]
MQLLTPRAFAILGLTALLLPLSGQVLAAPGDTTRVSVDSSGNEGNYGGDESAISADGRYVAFSSYADNLVAGDGNGSTDIFVHDRQTGTTTRVSVDSSGNEGNSYSYFPAISADGRYVAFYSYADNLVAGDGNGAADVFVHELVTATPAPIPNLGQWGLITLGLMLGGLGAFSRRQRHCRGEMHASS